MYRCTRSNKALLKKAHAKSGSIEKKVLGGKTFKLVETYCTCMHTITTPFPTKLEMWINAADVVFTFPRGK